MDKKDGASGTAGASGSEVYQRMNEKEKDAEIARSIIRLQSKIQEILYLTERGRAAEESTGKTNTPEKPEKTE